jgi:diadenylate cyclase
MDFISTFFSFSRFNIVDLIDILIVAVLIYEILLLIRGTRAVQIALGIAFIIFAYYSSQALNLKTLNWLLSNFLSYLVIAIIVLFQAEIRRGLASFGRNPFVLRAYRVKGMEDVIDEVVLAATTLAGNKIGAIVAFEKEIGLRSYIEGGIKIDALLSYDLLVSIFQPNSPIHDGAVIIQGNKIAAASCFLPLTSNPYLSRRLGTRHRAAIGLSEETDSIAIIVSEETGEVSYAYKGKVRRKLSPVTLKRDLYEFFDLVGRPEPVGRGFFGWLIKRGEKREK